MTARERAVFWNWEQGGLEYLRLRIDGAGSIGDGRVTGRVGDDPFHLRYVVLCDVSWRARTLDVEVLDRGKGISLRSEEPGRWFTLTGERVGAVEGCVDVDIAGVVYTNTLPIRRLRLEPGRSAELRVAYVEVPSLALAVSRQRYTCVESSEAGSRYLFEALDGTFSAELRTDADGLVLDYPGLARRVWSK